MVVVARRHQYETIEEYDSESAWRADFFHFHYQGFSWYVFNLADVAIVAGVALLLYESVFMNDASARRRKAYLRPRPGAVPRGM